MDTLTLPPVLVPPPVMEVGGSMVTPLTMAVFPVAVFKGLSAERLGVRGSPLPGKLLVGVPKPGGTRALFLLLSTLGSPALR